MYKKFTFKKTPRVGRYSSFEPDFTDIKLEGSKVGWIAEASHFSKFPVEERYGISFHVQDGESFRNITLKKRFPKEVDARDFLMKHNDMIQEKYKLHKLKE